MKKTIAIVITFSFIFLWIEGVFLLVNNFQLQSSFIRIVLFSLNLSLICALPTLVLSKKLTKIYILFITSTVALYALAQTAFHQYMGYFLSISTAKTQATNVTEYMSNFLKAIKLSDYLFFLPIIILWLAFITGFYNIPKQSKSLKQFSIFILGLVLSNVLAVSSLQWFGGNSKVFTPLALYYQPTIPELALKEYGVTRYLARDIQYLWFNQEEVLIIPPNPIIDEQPTEPDLTRTTLETSWRELVSRETNSRLKQIDEYLLAQPLPLINEYTGMFEGYNFIYIMVEAFDYNAIHPILTPTLYSMFTNGWNFDEFYSVKASCATGESEFMGLMSLIPLTTSCTPYDHYNNDAPASLFNLFKKQGYRVTSYHNYTDQFYPRTEWHKTMGSEQFYDSDALKVPMIGGWPSDIELMNRAYNVFKEHEEPFMAFIITSAMHFFYDTDTTLGNRYLDQVQAVYPDASIDFQRYLSKSIDFDKSMESLIKQLKQDNKLDNTIILLYGDHHPFRLELSELRKHSLIDRTGMAIDKNPLILYNPNLSPTTFSNPGFQVDLLLTVANLFDLKHDPRLYLGKDILAADDNIVIFTNGSWKNKIGEYWATSNKFIPYDPDNTYTNEKLSEMIQFVQSRFLISQEILKTDYYSYRHEIIP